jgi:surfeit locus 1 family protein
MRRWTLVTLAALGTAVLMSLGVWQVERRAWKLALIDRVEKRVHAAPVAAPGPNAWPGVNAENSEYLHVKATGHFIAGRETLVRASTALGPGYWVMAPLQTDQGFVVLVNRGFVPPEKRDPASRADATTGGDGASRAHGSADAPVTITGLLRMTEPKGAFLHANVPRESRWYSRDVTAIANAQGLAHAAPYFIDADASSNAGSVPVGGLTVIAFRNSHLVYAITWFTLALMTAALGVRIARSAEPRHA